MAANAVIALAGIAACGGAGSSSAVQASLAAAAKADLGFNRPLGLGGPSEGGGAAAAGTASAAGAAGAPLGGTSAPDVTGTAGLASTAGGKGRGMGNVDGSTALVGFVGMPWLLALGAGVSASAPRTVRQETDSPADATAGFYDAFYGQRPPAACGYVAPAQRAGCPVLLRESGGSADALRGAAIGFAVVKGDEALVTMTGLLCRPADGCVGQHNPHWIFGFSFTFDQLWGLAAAEGGNPLTVTPLTEFAGRWYVALPPSAAAG